MGSAIDGHSHRGAAGRLAARLLALVGLISLTTGLRGDGTPSAPVQYRHSSWSKNEGLPDPQVNAVLRTRDGFLWVGTRSGLARFDGVRFTLFHSRHEPALRNEDIRCLAQDAAGVLWIGTADGLASYDGRFHWIASGDRDAGVQFESGPPLGQVVVLCPDRRGNLWIGTANGLFRLRQRRIERIRYDGEASWRVWGIVEAVDSALWLNQGGALFRGVPDGDGLRFSMFCSARDVGQTSLHSLALDPDGQPRVLAGPKEGLVAEAFRCEDGRWAPTPELRAANGVRRVFLEPDGEGGFWIPETGIGLTHVQGGRRQAHRLWPVEAVNHALCIHLDGEGNVWAGSESAGLHLLQPVRVQTWSTEDGLAHDSIWAFFEDRAGRLWIGTEGGLSRLENGRIESFTTDHGLVNNSVRALAEDAAGRVWVGTGAGLEVREGTTVSRIQFEGEWFNTKIRALHGAPDGSMWVGTAKGLHQIQNGVTNSFFAINGLASEDIRAIHQDRRGVVWIGTAGGGLHRLERGLVTPISREQGVLSESVWVIHEDAEGVLWLGGDRGLCRWSGDRGLTFGTAQGLPDNLVNGLLEDAQGRFWIGHDHGIYRVDRAALEAVAAGRTPRVACVEYGEIDGLPSAETNGQKCSPSALRTRDGRLWFATTRGVAVIDPDRLPDPASAPLPFLDSVRLGDELVYPAAPSLAANTNRSTPTPRTPRVLVPPGSSRQLEFAFTAPTFQAPGELRFRHRLRGRDRTWVDDGTTRRVLYGGLAPGDYVFELQSLTKHGLSSPVLAAIPIQVLPAWYRSGWFYALAAVMLTGLAALAYRTRVIRLRRTHEAQAADALARERARIAHDLHDGLGANLTTLTWLAAQAENRSSGPTSDPERLQELSQSSRAALHELQDIIWSASPENDTIESLANRLSDQAMRMCELARVRCRLEFPTVFPAVRLPANHRQQLLLMAREALHNALRHAQPSELRLHLSVIDSELRLVIQDNGCGFVVPPPDGDRAREAQPTAHGQGLPHLRERARQIGAHLEVRSEPGQGTTVEICLPVEGTNQHKEPPGP